MSLASPSVGHTSQTGLPGLLGAGGGVLERILDGFLQLLVVSGENSLPVSLLLLAVSFLDRPGM